MMQIRSLFAIGLALALAPAWAQLIPPEADGARRAAQQIVRNSRAHAEKTDKLAGEVSGASDAAPAAVSPAADGAGTDHKARAASQQVGKRDPFVSIVRSSPVSPQCSGGGRKCLMINELSLKGVVRSPNGLIALVENGQRKAFFLRQNDPVFNGLVVQIEMNSITFQEKVMDKAGREKTRQIVKTMPGAKPGA